MPEKADVTIIIKYTPDAPELEGKIFPSSSVDVSLNGLQLTIDTDIPVGARVEVKVMFSHLTLEYWHSGSVIWNDKHDPRKPSLNEYTIGIRIESMADGRFYSWFSAVSELFERHTR